MPRRGLIALLLLAGTSVQAGQPADGLDPPDQREQRSITADHPPAQTPDARDPFDIFNNDRLTGDWGGARTWLEERGIEFNLSLTTVYQHNANGGLQTRNGHRITGSVDTELILDLEAMNLWPGGFVYALAESGWNDGIGDRIGNLFGVNGDAIGDEPMILSELWYEQSLLDDKVRIKLGKYDITVDFDANAYHDNAG